ncbi:unnamed protein product [Polarella glacialis]|uniref:Uncharacterized protein n=1 Tax=Polarella glacialis TaxID=89957 RepID=A0A813J8H3_POLGL|nr:unnamed protein product [Polarella glacialis]
MSGESSFHHEGPGPGPTNLEGVLTVNKDACRRIVEYANQTCDHKMLEQLKAWATEDHVVTSEMSGAGTFEVTHYHVRMDLAVELGVVPGKNVYYSSCDSDDGPQLALKSHGESTRPMHRFADLVDRIPKADREQMQAVLDESLGMLQSASQEHKFGLISKSDLIDLKRKLSDSLKDDLIDELNSVEFLPKAWCLACEQLCPSTPMAVDELKHMRWLVGAGVVCCPFSKMSPNPPWCDKSTLATLTFPFMCRFFEPDDVYTECVAGFQESIFHDILNVTEGALKSIISKPTNVNSAGTGYMLNYQIFSPTDIGVPTERNRKYCHWKGKGVAKPAVSFPELLFRRLDAKITVYLVAEQNEIDIDEHSATKKRRAVAAAAAGSGAAFGGGASHLTESECSHLEGFQLLAKKKRLCDVSGKVWAVEAALVSVTQTSCHNPTISTNSVQTLLRKTLLHDLVQNKQVTTAEMWLIQGFPRPGLQGVSELVSAKFPFPAAIAIHPSQVGADSKLTVQQERSLIGNSMHVAQVGHFLLHSALSK